ncbi:hypothetical protein CCAX7_57970 [Capsulimonas corticalis]|uniref:Uncharacterized protein n=1 Tax=Capsulimonas corticalis TaxID=2219043 RepID=A0A402D023_9BACT|nr:hypothetical protein [Capsulimonas corticalis]BDI33746.1 hypothetical protein CCAX7_57970 [Capsulimonas corticalis]
MAVQIARLSARTRRLSPFQSYALYLWTQYRLNFAVVALPWLISALLAHFAYAGQITSLQQCDGLKSVTMLAFPLLTILSPLVLLSKIDDRLWTLPIKTRTLVAWNMTIGAAAVALLWIVTTFMIWRPVGLNAPLLGPAALLAALYAWSFAVTRWPGGFRIIAEIAYVIGAYAATKLAAAGAAHAIPDGVLTAAYFAIAMLAFPPAAAGAQYTRSGMEKVRREARRGRANSALLAKFRTPEHAQLWYEWRARRWAILSLSLAPGVLALLCPVLARVITNAPPLPNHWSLYGVSSINWIFVCVNFAVIVAFSMITGAFAPRYLGSKARPQGAMALRFAIADLGVAAFLKVRPMDATAFIVVNLRVITLMTAAMWISLIPSIVLWLLAPTTMGSFPTTQGHALIAVLSAPGNVHLCLLAIAALIGSVFLSWTVQAEMLTLSLTGRGWIIIGGYYTIKVTLLLTALGLDWLNMLPYAPVSLVVIGAITLSASIKLLLLIQSMRALRRSRRVPVSTIRRASIAWAITAGFFFALFCAALAPQGVAWWVTALGVFLLMPGLGLSIAAPAFAWDRNR